MPIPPIGQTIYAAPKVCVLPAPLPPMHKKCHPFVQRAASEKTVKCVLTIGRLCFAEGNMVGYGCIADPAIPAAQAESGRKPDDVCAGIQGPDVERV